MGSESNQRCTFLIKKMLKDKFGRSLELLEISARGDCQWENPWPGESGALSPVETFPAEHVLRFAGMMAMLGLKKVRLSGGEPLGRPDIIPLLSGLAGIKPRLRLSMVTDGRLLASLSPEIKLSGFDRLFVTLPALDPILFKSITGKDDLDEILLGIDTARTKYNAPLAVSVPLIAGVNDHAMEEITDWAVSKGLDVYLVEQAKVADRKVYSDDRILARLRKRYKLTRMRGYSVTNNPWRVEGHKSFIKIVTASGMMECGSCNRVWLSADGVLSLCSFINQKYDLKTLFVDDPTDAELAEFAAKIPLNKPLGLHNDGAQSAYIGMARV